MSNLESELTGGALTCYLNLESEPHHGERKMAFQEIPDEPYEEKSFFKFNAVGDKFVGLYVSQAEGKYGTDFTFRNKTGPFVVTAKGALKAKLDKAGLKPGYLVRATFTGTKDVGKDSPMRLIKVEVDNDPAKPAPVAPKPAADDFDL